MKIQFLSTGISLALFVSSGATVTWDVSIGYLRSSSGDKVPEGTLWAMIYQNAVGELPGGLDLNRSLTITDAAALSESFAGVTIKQGSTVGGSTILQTGSTDTLSTANYSIAGAESPPFPGVAAGGVWGLYWFPGLTAANNLVPADRDFELGGFTQTDLNGKASGNQGTTIPSDGVIVTTYFFDKDTTQEPTDLPASRFTAVSVTAPVPEPSTLVLSVLGLAALLRRRR